MRIIILGFGHIAKLHYLKWCIYNPAIEHVSIYDSKINSVDILEDKYFQEIEKNSQNKLNILNSNKKIEDIFLENKFNKALILTNNTSHFYLAKIALDNNCDVLVEKPATISSKGFKYLEEKAIKKNKFFFPAYHQLFRSETDQFIDELAKYLKKNKLKEVLISSGSGEGIPSHSLKGGFSEIEKSGGGVLLDLGSHFINLFFYFLKETDNIKLFSKNYFITNHIFIKDDNSEVENKFKVTLKNSNFEVKIKLSYIDKYETVVIFSSNTSKIKWPPQGIKFSNLAFKNMLEQFLFINNKITFKEFSKSNYYQSILITIETIENLYANSNFKLKNVLY